MGWEWVGMEWSGMDFSGVILGPFWVIFWTKKRHFKMSFLRAGFFGTKKRHFKMSFPRSGFFGQKKAISKCRSFGSDFFGQKKAISKCRSLGPDFLDKKTPFQNIFPSGRIFDRFSTFCRKTKKTCFFKPKKKTPQADPLQ